MTRKHIVTYVLILLGVVIIVFFGMRALHAFRKFTGHRPPPPGSVETDVQLIRDWMTVPFISRMYHVSGDMIFEALNVSPKGNQNKSLKVLNEEYYPNKSGYVLTLVKTTILAHQPPPLPDAPHNSTPIPTTKAPLTP